MRIAVLVMTVRFLFPVLGIYQTGHFTFKGNIPFSNRPPALKETLIVNNALSYCAVQCKMDLQCQGIEICPKHEQYLCRLCNFTNSVFSGNGTNVCRYLQLDYQLGEEDESYTPFDCSELQDKGHTLSGVYTIYPWKTENKSVKVFCDMDTLPGGFTVFQRRLDGSVSFDRTFGEYRRGFGNATSEYWIGNDILHLLTSEHSNTLYVKLGHTNGTSFYQRYAGFSISDGNDDFRLSIDLPSSGTAGDSLITRYNLAGQTFKTPDHDNSNRRCSTAYTRGGWWFKDCHEAYLNGVYGSSGWTNPWYTCIGYRKYFKSSVMMIRRNE